MAAPTSAVSDRAVSYLRTVVPVLWGSAVAGLLTAVTLPVEVTDLLGSELAATAVTAVAVGVWYIAWRWAEPRLPDWLRCVVLGSARTPRYDHGTLYGAQGVTGRNGSPHPPSTPSPDHH